MNAPDPLTTAASRPEPPSSWRMRAASVPVNQKNRTAATPVSIVSDPNTSLLAL